MMRKSASKQRTTNFTLVTEIPSESNGRGVCFFLVLPRYWPDMLRITTGDVYLWIAIHTEKSEPVRRHLFPNYPHSLPAANAISQKCLHSFCSLCQTWTTWANTLQHFPPSWMTSSMRTTFCGLSNYWRLEMSLRLFLLYRAHLIFASRATILYHLTG